MPVFSQDKTPFCELDYEAEVIKQLDITPVYIDLRECITIAILNSSLLKSSYSLYESKDFEYKYSLTGFLPQIGLRAYTSFIKGQLLVGGALIADLNEQALFGAIYLKHDLTNGGKLFFEILSSKNLKKAQYYNYQGTFEQLLYETAISYYELIQEKLFIQNLLTALCERKYQYEITKARYEVGEGEKYDVLRTQIEVKQNEAELIDAIVKFRIKQAHLATLIGLDATSSIMPIEKDIKQYHLLGNLTTNEIYENAIKILPNIKKQEAEIASLKNQRNQNFSDIIPKFSFDLTYSSQGTVKLGSLPNATATINVDIPFGDRILLGTIAKYKALDKQIKALEYKLVYEKNVVRENILTSFETSKKTLEKISILETQHDLATKSQDIVSMKFFEGEEELLNVIQSQTRKTQTELELSRTKVAYNISQLELLYFSGLISVENILNGYSP